MFVNKYIQATQLGRIQKTDCLDLQFLLPRFESKSEDIFAVQVQDSNVPPYSVQFCKAPGQEHIYALGFEQGEVIFVNSNKPAKTAHTKRWQAHNNAVFDLCWLRHSDKLITASGDQTSVLWDTTTLEKLSSFEGHVSSVKTISLSPANECIFLTGSRDGNICLWDSRTISGSHHKPIYRIPGAHENESQNNLRQRKRLRKGIPPSNAKLPGCITCVLFQNENTFLSTGASDWSIKGWDLRQLRLNKLSGTTVPQFNINNAIENHKAHGYTSLVMNPNEKTFFANCTDGSICQYEIGSRTPQLVSTYYGHEVKSSFVKMDISYDGQFLVSGSSDEKAYIWKVSKPGAPLVSLDGHEAEVTVVAWHPRDVTKLITCGDDDKIFKWTIGDISPKMNDGSNTTKGESQFVDPKSVRHPSTAPNPLQGNSLKTTSPATPSSNKRTSVPLTQWFTPKGKDSQTLSMKPASGDTSKSATPNNKTICTLNNEFTPKMTFAMNTEAATPVKVPPRTILGNLSNSGRKERVDSNVESIRRSINFGAHSEQRTEKSKVAAQSQAKKIKISKSGIGNNYSIKNFFPSTPRSNVLT